MAGKRLAILFDIDGTLIITGGAGATSWRLGLTSSTGSRLTSVGSPTPA